MTLAAPKRTLAAPERISAAPKKDLSAMSGTLAAPRNALFVPVIHVYKRVRFQVYTHKKVAIRPGHPTI